MKRTYRYIVATLMIAACSQPLNITTKTDPQATTSGTMGSVQAENQMPQQPVARPVDTVAVPARP